MSVPPGFVKPVVDGDFNENGILDVQDIDLLTIQTASGTHDPLFDMTQDQLVNEADIDQWVAIKPTWIGDSNLDGEFNSSDFVQVFEKGKFETGIQAVWSEGDWNGDGTFGTGDFVKAFQAGGFEAGPRLANVPEPTSVLFLLIAITLLRRGCKRVNNNRK